MPVELESVSSAKVPAVHPGAVPSAVPAVHPGAVPAVASEAVPASAPDHVRRVAVGMSGGVDSSVAAALLIDAGYQVVGVTCEFVHDEKTAAAVRDAAAVCAHLGIPHIVHDCADLFECQVVQHFVAEYACGRTPSPCVTCNMAAKIPALMSAARAAECDAVATGHYARIVHDGGRWAVQRARTDKDQSYMLAMLSQDQLANLVLPLGEMDKSQIRELAERMGLPVAHRADSQDICFIDGSHVDFLIDSGVACEPGEIVDTQGRVLGRHNGLARYTLGQRKGIGIGGVPEPLFAIGKDAQANRLIVGPHASTLIGSVEVRGVNWQAAAREDVLARFEEHGPVLCAVKLRYRTQAVDCRVRPVGVDGLRIELAQPQPITAPGQFAVLYSGDTVLAAGAIEEVSTHYREVFA